MILRNKSLSELHDSYLFVEIAKRKREFLERNPSAKVISLGVGDTTHPIPDCITHAMAEAALRLSDPAKYTGYGPGTGYDRLRERISERIYQGTVSPDEIVISDGAKCDLGRLQLLFGPDVSIAVQDPAYPVYIDGSRISGVSRITLLPCTPENNFFPAFSDKERYDLIYICSPNNPTGSVATRTQLEALVAHAVKQRSIILFDASYFHYIQGNDLPRSIFEIPGAREVAIEINSFSKIAGFTGVRLGWTVVPRELKYESGESVLKDWTRVMTTIFNGASNIVQEGGLAVLSDEGWEAVGKLTAYYLENARILKTALQGTGIPIYGGDHAPYIWAKFPGKNSWELFQEILEKFHLVTVPGSGFGKCGEGFLRMTTFSPRADVEEAAARLQKSIDTTRICVKAI